MHLRLNPVLEHQGSTRDSQVQGMAAGAVHGIFVVFLRVHSIQICAFSTVDWNPALSALPLPETNRNPQVPNRPVNFAFHR